MRLTKALRACGVLSLLAIILVGLLPTAQAQGDAWHVADRSFRMPITVNANGFARTDHIAERDINFTTLLTALEQTGAFAPESLRVVEVNSTGTEVINANVVYQFDRANGYNATSNASGRLVFLMAGQTTANQTRYFHVYFDTGSGFTTPTFTPRVTRLSDVNHRGQDSFRIQTQRGTYYYHKVGAGFASLIDANGADWISFYPNAGSRSAGEFRGIPNVGAVFHPGYNRTYAPGQGNVGGSLQGSTSTIENPGPLKLTIRSISSNGQWEATWEMYPTHATMSMLRHGGVYWFLYEGTPGGNLNFNESNTSQRDFVVRSTSNTAGTRIDAGGQWGEALNPSWVYFGDAAQNRSLFAVQHSADNLADSYRHQQNADRVMPPGTTDNGAMTVFGFGRILGGNITPQINTPQRFTIGLVESKAENVVPGVINALYQPATATSGPVQARPPAQPENRPPVANDDTAETFRNTPVVIDILANDEDPDGDMLTPSVVSTTNGTAEISNNQLVFTPWENFTGNATVVYRVEDGRGGSNTATVTIIVRPAVPTNRPPVVRDDTATTAPNTPVTIDVLANDEDPDGDELTVAVLSVTNGTAVVENNQVVFTPEEDFTGTAQVEYQVQDGRGGSDIAMVTVTVTETVTYRVYFPVTTRQ